MAELKEYIRKTWGIIDPHIELVAVPHRENVFRCFVYLNDNKTAVIHAKIDEDETIILSTMVFGPDNGKRLWIDEISMLMDWKNCTILENEKTSHNQNKKTYSST